MPFFLYLQRDTKGTDTLRGAPLEQGIIRWIGLS